MFVYSVRASTIKFFGFVFLSVALLFGIVFLGGGEAEQTSGRVGIDYDGVKSAEGRIAFIENFGIEVEPEPLSEESFRMQENFDRVILGYNELQKKQGLDLTKYKKKRVTRYTYRVANYDYETEVVANLFIYRGKVIACDISSLDPEGFVCPMTLVDRTKLK